MNEQAILDKINEWHEDISLEMSLHKYLDMTVDEYEKYVEDNNFGQCDMCGAIIKEGQKAIRIEIVCSEKWFCCEPCEYNYIHSK